jgi:hypothetical protein
MSARVWRAIIAATFTITAAGGANAQPRVWAVSPSGNDSNAGTEAAPFLTIQKAADVVNPGDTVMVEDGVYSGAGTSCGSGVLPVVCLKRGGTASAWVTFQARHAGRAKIDGRSNTSTHGFLFKGASYVTLSGFEIVSMGNPSGAAHGVMIDLGHDIVLSQLHIHDIGRVCTSTSQGLTGVFVRVPHVTITRSVFHDIGRFLPGENGCTANTTAHFDHAIYVSGEYYSSTTPGASDTLITNNLFYRIQRGWSVHLYPGTLQRMSILNNTFAFANTPAEEGQIIIAASTSDSRIMNNVFYSPRNAAVYYYDGTQTNLQIRNNIVYGTTKMLGAVPSGTTVSGITFTDPRFVNVVTEPYDFHLLTVSPAINTGVNVSEVVDDFYGVARNDGRTDISAVEYAGGVIQQTATPTISPNGGTITGPTAVAISSATPGATIRYTLDGSLPGSSSAVYSAPFTIGNTTTVKSVAAAIGMTDSNIATATFQLSAPPAPPPPAGDATPPTVSITSPANGSSVAKRATITAVASDNVGVASVTFIVDGETIATDTTGPYSTTGDFKRGGQHSITVIATDGAGNKATASITVHRGAGLSWPE